MTFDINIPTSNGSELKVQLECGKLLFVLGANGTGKSSLMYHFSRKHFARSRKISAHRQTWMKTDALDMTPRES